MEFEVCSSTEVATGPQSRLVRVGGRCRADAVGQVAPPALLVDGLRVRARERTPIRLGPAWSPFALSYVLPQEIAGDGWMLEVAPPSDPQLEAACRALE